MRIHVVADELQVVFCSLLLLKVSLDNLVASTTVDDFFNVLPFAVSTLQPLYVICGAVDLFLQFQEIIFFCSSTFSVDRLFDLIAEILLPLEQEENSTRH